MIECWPGRRTSFLRSGMCMELWSSQGDRERHRVAIGKSACFDIEAVVEIDGVKAGPTRSHLALRNLRVDRSNPRTASGSSDSCGTVEFELVLVFEKPGRYSLPIQDITRIRCKPLHQGRASIECRDSVVLLSSTSQSELDKLLEFVRDAKCKNSLSESRPCATCKEKGERKKAKQKKEQQPAVLECSFRRKQLPSFVDAGQEQVYLKDLLRRSDEDYVPRKLHKTRSSVDGCNVRSVEADTEFVCHSNPFIDTIWAKGKKHDDQVPGSPERSKDTEVRDHRTSSPTRKVMFIDEILKYAVDGPRRREAQRIVNEKRKDIQRGVRVKVSDNEKENCKVPTKEDARRSSENMATEIGDERKTSNDTRRKVYDGQSKAGDEFAGNEERRDIESERRRAEQKDKILSRRESLRKLVQLESKRKDQWEMMREEFASKEEERNLRIGIENDKRSLNEWESNENRREEEFRADKRTNSLERIRQEEKRQRLDEDRKIQEQRRREDEEHRAESERRMLDLKRKEEEDRRVKEAERRLQELKRKEEEDKRLKEAERRLQELKRKEAEDRRVKEAERRFQELKRKEEEDKRVREAERRLQELKLREEEEIKKAKEAEQKAEELRRIEEEDKKAKESEQKLRELKLREEEDRKAKDSERKFQELNRKEEEDKKAREAVRKLHDLRQRERKENDKRCKEANRRMQEQVQEERRKHIEEKVEEALNYFKLDECREEVREREEMRNFEGSVKNTIRLPQRFRSRVWEEELVVEGCGRVLDEERDKTELRKFDENMRTWLAEEYKSRSKDSNGTVVNQKDSNFQGLRRCEGVTKTTSRRMHINKEDDALISDEQTIDQRNSDGNDNGDAQTSTHSQSRTDSDDEEEQNRGFHERVAFLDQFLNFTGIQRARIDEELRLAKDSERFNFPGMFSKIERSRQEDLKKQELVRKKAAKAADEQKKKLAQERLRAAKAEAKRLEKLLKEAQKLAKAQERARQQQKAEEHARRKAASKGGAEISGFSAVHHLTFAQYEESWNSIKLSERTSILSYTDIPWPPHDNPLYVEAGDSLVAQRRKLRSALLRWHPDKFLALCGHRLSPLEREFIEARAKRVAEKVMQWKCMLDGAA